MVEKRRGLPVGLLIAAPPLLAGLYLGGALLLEEVLPGGLPDPVEAPLEWFFGEAVLEPSLEAVGLSTNPSDYTELQKWVILLTTWLGFFLLVGVVLGGMAALANLLVFGVGRSRNGG